MNDPIPEDTVIDFEKLVRAWGAKDLADFKATIESGRFYAIDINTGETVTPFMIRSCKA